MALKPTGITTDEPAETVAVDIDTSSHLLPPSSDASAEVTKPERE